MRMMGRVNDEILHIQAAQVFGGICKSCSEHISQKLRLISGEVKRIGRAWILNIYGFAALALHSVIWE